MGYDATRVRPSIEVAFKKLGFSGPISSTGVTVAQTKPESTCSLMYSNMVEWRDHNPPPATMMLISDQWREFFSWDLARLQQHTKYNLYLAYPFRLSALLTCGEWIWKELLEPKSSVQDMCTTSESSPATFYCKSCRFKNQSVLRFRKHLSSRKHAVQEVINPIRQELNYITKTWGKNYSAKPEYATAQIAVWWDMMDCPIPEGYDARNVRPSIEAAFNKLGYSGPVYITAYGDRKQTSDDILRGLSSTGVGLAHTPER
ncbi:hypothetical protein CARUB_v10028598mg [Capsella rubella]|uniref:NYN domain-containing protein n=1 Tax=Capsella rubella TaxID=81985 RepID=R0F1N4_9BRAS|nr:hypothetical protein CARUB_v10028598mg [Capsella rubella]